MRRIIGFLVSSATQAGACEGDCVGKPQSRQESSGRNRRISCQGLVLPPCAGNAFSTVFGMDTAEDLSHQLWTLRELLEELVYKLEVQRLLLGAGKTRWLPFDRRRAGRGHRCHHRGRHGPPARPGRARRPLRPRPHGLARRPDRRARRATRRHPAVPSPAPHLAAAPGGRRIARQPGSRSPRCRQGPRPRRRARRRGVDRRLRPGRAGVHLDPRVPAHRSIGARP